MRLHQDQTGFACQDHLDSGNPPTRNRFTHRADLTSPAVSIAPAACGL